MLRLLPVGHATVALAPASMLRLLGHATGVNVGPTESRAAGAGVLRPCRRRQYRPATYSQAESKCVIAKDANWAVGPGVGPLSASQAGVISCLQ
jgi:hypothetical protein